MATSDPLRTLTHAGTNAAAAADERAALPGRHGLGLAALCLLFSALAAADLGNVRPVSGDDALILTVSAHLAETGSFGSPSFDGVFGADEHYFLNLPLQHLLHAAVFRTIGEGVAQARVVSLIAALVLLCASTLLALRWFGARVAAGTALLLVVWRSGVIGLDYGLPLLAVARTARYDVTAVALVWLALLAFDTHLRRPNRAWALTTGLLAAAAILAQFHGALVLPALAALWAARRDGTARFAGLGWLALGLLLGLAPYLIYFAAHAGDALAQMRLVHADRITGGPGGLLRSVLTEPMRFSAAAMQRGVGQLGLLFALGAGPLLVRNGRTRPLDPAARTGTRGLLFVTAAMLLTLALFEPTKAPLYALPLVPSFCMLVAGGLDALWRLGRSGEGPRSRAVQVAALAIAAGLTAEGIVALVRDRVAAARVTPYAAMASQIDASMEAGAALAGPAQWSWGLRAHPYEEFRALALRQQALAIAGRTVSPIDAVLRERRVRFILINDDVRSDLQRGFYGEPFGAALTRYLDTCTSAVRVWRDATYGVIDLRAVTGSCADE